MANTVLILSLSIICKVVLLTSAQIPSTTRSDPFEGLPDVPPVYDCANICQRVCTTSNLTLDCMCTQAYFDSQYECNACGTALLGSDDLEKVAAEALQTLQKRCAERGQTLTTQPATSVYTPGSASQTTAASGTGSAASAGRGGEQLTSTGLHAGGESNENGDNNEPGGSGDAVIERTITFPLVLVAFVLVALAI